MPKHPRQPGFAGLVAVVLTSLFAVGCGEPEQPAPTPAQLDTAKKDREEIISKEYGAGAMEKARAAEAAKIK